MANLVAMNMKRKDAEVASHGFSIFLDPKRIKLQVRQLDAEIPEMMEEEEPPADAPPANVHPTIFMPSLSLALPTQGQEAIHGNTVSTTSRSKCSEPPFSEEDQAAPMDVEVDIRQCQALAQPGSTPLSFQVSSDEWHSAESSGQQSWKSCNICCSSAFTILLDQYMLL